MISGTMTMASSGKGLEKGWRALGAGRRKKIRGSIFSLLLVVYLALYLAVAGQVGTWTWMNGGHVTPEHLSYHTLLLNVGITDHRVPDQKQANDGPAGLKRALLIRGLQSPAIDIEHGGSSVFFSAAQHLSNVEPHLSAPMDDWAHPAVAGRVAPASLVPPPPVPPPRDLA